MARKKKTSLTNLGTRAGDSSSVPLDFSTGGGMPGLGVGVDKQEMGPPPPVSLPPLAHNGGSVNLDFNQASNMQLPSTDVLGNLGEVGNMQPQAPRAAGRTGLNTNFPNHANSGTGIADLRQGDKGVADVRDSLNYLGGSPLSGDMPPEALTASAPHMLGPVNLTQLKNDVHKQYTDEDWRNLAKLVGLAGAAQGAVQSMKAPSLPGQTQTQDQTQTQPQIQNTAEPPTLPTNTSISGPLSPPSLATNSMRGPQTYPEISPQADAAMRFAAESEPAMVNATTFIDRNPMASADTQFANEPTLAPPEPYAYGNNFGQSSQPLEAQPFNDQTSAMKPPSSPPGFADAYSQIVRGDTQMQPPPSATNIMNPPVTSGLPPAVGQDPLIAEFNSLSRARQAALLGLPAAGVGLGTLIGNALISNRQQDQQMQPPSPQAVQRPQVMPKYDIYK